jgi:hypothetical protein
MSCILRGADMLAFKAYNEFAGKPRPCNQYMVSC